MTALLRPWTPDDGPALLRAAQVSPDLDAQLPRIPATVAEAEELVADWTLADNRVNFAIDLDGLAIGNIGVAAVERRHDTAWVSYWISTEFRGRGITAAGLAAAAAWAFDDLGLFRLELGHRMNNPASCRVALRAGFIAEGIERQKLRYGQDRFDVETHARLRTDPTPDISPLPLTTKTAC